MRPYTVIFSTETLDGRIASATGYSKLSCRKDLELLHEARSWADAVVVGRRTVALDDPRLNVRLLPGPSPYRVILDPRLRSPPSSRVFAEPGKSIVVATELADPSRVRELESRGVRVIIAGRAGIDLARAWEELYSLGLKRVLIEGGGVTNCLALAGGVVDEVRVTVSPFIFGSGRSLAECGAFDGENSRVELALEGFFEVCPGYVHLMYRVIRPRTPLDSD